MKNIKNEPYFVDSIPNNNWYRTQRDCYPFNRFGKKKLDERRKYEVLKHSANKSNLTRAQQYSNINNRRSLVRNCDDLQPKFFSPSASNVPGKWDITVDSNFLNIPVTNIAVRNQYTSGPSGKYNYFDSTPQNFNIPFKILSKILVDVSFESVNNLNYFGLSFELINDNSYSINDISQATIYINEIGAIRDDNNGYSSNINDWVLLGNSSIYGRFYTTAIEEFTDVDELIVKMIRHKILEYNHSYTGLTDNSFNDISNNYTVNQLLNQLVDYRNGTTYIVNLNTNDLHIKLSKTDGSNRYLTGYLGKKNNKVYFISDRDYIKYDFSFSSINEIDISNNTTFDTNTLLNMSLYDYGFDAKLKIC